MSTFLFAYRAPKNYRPGDPDTTGAWRAWFEELGAGVSEMGNPVFERITVGSSPGETVLGGYSLITAEDLEAAVALAKGCPILERGGAVEVGELGAVGPAPLAAAVEDCARAADLAG